MMWWIKLRSVFEEPPAYVIAAKELESLKRYRLAAERALHHAEAAVQEYDKGIAWFKQYLEKESQS